MGSVPHAGPARVGGDRFQDRPGRQPWRQRRQKHAVAEGEDEVEDDGSGEDCKDEDAGGDDGSTDDDDEGFRYNDDDYHDQDGAEEARAARAAAEPRCGG